MPTLQIDPKTGERIPASAPSNAQIDPTTGERIATAPAQGVEEPSLWDRAKANFNAGTQHAPAPTGLLDMFSPKRAVQNFGASAGDAIRATRHALDKQPNLTLDQQYDRAGQQVGAFAKDPVAAYVNAAGQAAPGLIAGVGTHDLLDAVPNTQRAADTFNSLSDELANHPVPLTDKTLKPLLRATEIGARGGTLPKSVSDLLTRSQSPIDMTYPEIRDYQSNLTDLSRESKGSMNRKMLGQIGRVNGGMYDDIYDALGPTGRADDFASAMKEFRQAQQIKSGLKKTAIPLAVGGASAVAGPSLVHYLKGLF